MLQREKMPSDGVLTVLKQTLQLPHQVEGLHQLHGAVPPLVVGVDHVRPAQAPADEVGPNLVGPHGRVVPLPDAPLEQQGAKP